MFKYIVAILFSVLMAIPLIPICGIAGAEFSQTMVEDIQETQGKSTSLVDEEVKMVHHLDVPFYNVFEGATTSAPLQYVLRDEALYKFCHYDELIQPPNC